MMPEGLEVDAHGGERVSGDSSHPLKETRRPGMAIDPGIRGGDVFR